ncbi:MAG: SDR family NAD(P)-dependent oxidoreductase [Ignavibacteriaceae bacterium]|nr:SDR family NAD(P)-dependent oxidoreductase [Ignavibacteriaceae bacterium]
MKNKTILITGASTGIGKALAIKLAKNNKLILLARNIDLLSEIKKESCSGDNVDIYKCDVTKIDEVKEVFSSIVSKHNEIDLAILNSGVSYRNSIEDYSSEKAKITMDTNYLGVIFCVEQLLPIFLRQKKGIIAGVSSLADARGFVKSGFYCASKAALTAYLESLRAELIPYGIKVVTIKPGFVKTPMTDKNEFKMPLLMEVDEAADIIINGLIQEKRIIQFPMPIVLAVKFLKIIPNFLFEFISRNQLRIVGNKD